MGFRGPLLSWIRSFLTNRSQHVNIGGYSSYSRPITIGVPQGSTLGPLLFILYINDMQNCLTNMGIIHFADDSTLRTLNLAEITIYQLQSTMNYVRLIIGYRLIKFA